MRVSVKAARIGGSAWELNPLSEPRRHGTTVLKTGGGTSPPRASRWLSLNGFVRRGCTLRWKQRDAKFMPEGHAAPMVCDPKTIHIPAAAATTRQFLRSRAGRVMERPFWSGNGSQSSWSSPFGDRTGTSIESGPKSVRIRNHPDLRGGSFHGSLNGMHCHASVHPLHRADSGLISIEAMVRPCNRSISRGWTSTLTCQHYRMRP
jgi:hypothetical protein